MTVGFRFTPGRLAIAILCVLLIAFLAWQVAIHGWVTAFDQQVTQWWAAHREPALTRAMLFVSAAHEMAKLLGAAALVGAWLLIRRKRPLLWVLPVIPVGIALNAGVKEVFARPRPHLAEPLVQLSTFSFPSGHAAGSTVFYGALCALVFAHTPSRGWRALACCVAAVMVVLVAFSRVYLGAHYVSDVIAGMAEGLACLALLLPRLRRPGVDSRA